MYAYPSVLKIDSFACIIRFRCTYNYKIKESSATGGHIAMLVLYSGFGKSINVYNKHRQSINDMQH